MASEGGPDAEFHDPERKNLLEALTTALSVDVIQSPTVWACLWVSDIDCLRSLVAQAARPAQHAQPRGSVSMLQLFRDTEVYMKIVQKWTQRHRPSSTASTPLRPATPQQPSPLRPATPQQPSPLQPATPQQPSPLQGSVRGQKRRLDSTRSNAQKALCYERDQKKCVLTEAGEPIDAAHIYPFSMRNENGLVGQSAPSFWDALRYFWTEERVCAWHTAIFPTGTEVCSNLICLTPNAHAYWERAYFALKPIRLSDDKKRLDLQFFWLPPRNHVSQVNILQVPSLPKNLDQGPNSTKLFSIKTDKKICSGDKISLETDDPVTRPLPDVRLLEMQWYLHRVAAMSGAAEPRVDFYDDSDDDRI